MVVFESSLVHCQVRIQENKWLTAILYHETNRNHFAFEFITNSSVKHRSECIRLYLGTDVSMISCMVVVFSLCVDQ